MKWLLLMLLALGGWLLWREKTASDDSADSLDLEGYSFGQVGSNLTVNETTGSVLAKAISQLFDSGAQGQFEYVGPDFTLRTSTLDLGGRTLLHVISSAAEFQEKAGQYNRNVYSGMIIQMPFTIPGSYSNFVEVIGNRQPGFNQNDPTTYIIR